jgi:hypothetical protein
MRPAASRNAGLVPWLLCALHTAAQAAPSIYTCIDAKGRRLTSDRPIPECLDQEQRLLNSDGSLKRVQPPVLTPAQRLERDRRERELAAERDLRAEAARRDRQLLSRYPDEASHERARQRALVRVLEAQQAVQVRLEGLATERAKLMQEAEFYRDKPWPQALKGKLDANEAAEQALHDSSAGHAAERARIEANYDRERIWLRRLWAGEAPGTVRETREAEPGQPGRHP